MPPENKVEALKKALKDQPNDPAILKDLGYNYLLDGHYKSAKEQFRLATLFNPRAHAGILNCYEFLLDKAPDNISLHMSLADYFLSISDIDSAVLEFEEILDHYPEKTELYNILGRIYLLQGETDKLICLLEQAFDNNVEDNNLSEILASVYLEKGKIAEAAALYEKILEAMPNSKKILRTLGELYTRLKQYPIAAQKYLMMFSDDPEVSKEVCLKLEELLILDQKSSAIREVLADVYLRAVQPAKALEKYTEIIKIAPQRLDDMIVRLRRLLKNYPDHPEALFELSSALIKRKEFSDAVETLQRFYKAVPGELEKVIKELMRIIDLFPEQILAHQFLAEVYSKKGQPDKALMSFRRSVEIDPTCVGTILEKVKEVVSLNPGLLFAQQVLGEMYILKGDFRKALSVADAILSAQKEHAPAYLIQGDAYMALRLSKKAKESYAIALKLSPFSPEIHRKLESVAKKEIDLEIEEAKKQIQENPWKASLRLQLGKLLLQQGNKQAALQELQAASKDSTRAPFANNLAGQLFKSEGRFDLAMPQFQRALEGIPPELSELSKNLRFNLATTYEAQGDIVKAISIYEEIVQEDVSFGDLAARIKLLKANRLSSLRNRKLIMLKKELDTEEIIGLWGQEPRNRNAAKPRDDLNISFGQNHNNTGFEFFMKMMVEGAREEFSLAVELDARFTAALNNLAVVLTCEKRYDDAEAKLLSALNIENESAVYLNNLGLIYMINGQFKLAENSLKKAYALAPYNGAIIITLADVLYLAGKVSEAIQTYKKVGSFDVLREIAENRLKHKVLF